MRENESFGMQSEIRELFADEDLERSVRLVRQAFGTVAEDLGITQENWPYYTGFLTLEKLKENRQPDERFYGLFEGEKQVGFVTIQKTEDGNCVFRKLALLPELRHKGYGRNLVSFVEETARGFGAKKVSLAMAEENSRLKKWYETLGYRAVESKRFEGFAWTICFMEKEIAQASD